MSAFGVWCPRSHGSKKVKKGGTQVQINLSGKLQKMIALVCAVLLLACGSAREFTSTLLTYRYDLSPLKGKVVSNLYCMYLGTCGKMPQMVMGVPAEKLRKMWAFKIARSPGNADVRNTAHTLLQEYRTMSPTRMSLWQYRAYVANVIARTKQKMDWERLARLKRVYHYQFELIRSIARSISERDILAYGLTELMPSDKGELNLQVLEIMLRTDGKEFIEGIPALGDTLVSFGPYQFTYLALRHTPGQITETCVVNLALPKSRRIPESVAKLRGDDHYVAAYLFATANVANLVHALNDRQFDVLSKKWKSCWPSVVQYIAVSHHGPSAAKRFAKAWLNDNCRKEYAAYCDGRYRLYAAKAAANYRALK